MPGSATCATRQSETGDDEMLPATAHPCTHDSSPARVLARGVRAQGQAPSVCLARSLFAATLARRVRPIGWSDGASNSGTRGCWPAASRAVVLSYRPTRVGRVSRECGGGAEAASIETASLD